jgi:hypothetical protein
VSGEYKTKFFTFNIGHIVTIIVYIASFAYFLGTTYETLESHAKSIDSNTSEIKELRKDIREVNDGMVVAKGSVLAVAAIDLRITRTEQAIQKIEVLQNDMDWFKKFIILDQSKKDAINFPTK